MTESETTEQRPGQTPDGVRLMIAVYVCASSALMLAAGIGYFAEKMTAAWILLAASAVAMVLCLITRAWLDGYQNGASSGGQS